MGTSVSIQNPSREAELVKRVQAGDRDAFLDLIRPHERALNLLCYVTLRNPDDAQEIAQESLVKALSHLGQLREGECFKSWLLRIAINEARMLQRRRRSYPAESIESHESAIDRGEFKPRDFTDWREIPSEALERKELGMAILRALRSLDEIYVEVFIMRDVEHLNVAQTAKLLGISEASVHTRLHRARLQMREQLSAVFRQKARGWTSLSMMFDMGKQYMHRTISCKRVIKEISRYIDGSVEPELRRSIEKHLRMCRRCRVLLDTTRMLLYVVGDGEMFAIPLNSNQRIRRLFDAGSNDAKGVAVNA